MSIYCTENSAIMTAASAVKRGTPLTDFTNIPHSAASQSAGDIKRVKYAGALKQVKPSSFEEDLTKFEEDISGCMLSIGFRELD